MMNLILGASGYIGQYLFKIFQPVCGTYLKHPIEGCGDFQQLDIRDRKAIQDLFQKVRPKIIFNLVWDRQNLQDSIVKGTENIIAARAKFCNESRLIFLSTDAVFCGNASPYEEGDEPMPIWEYGRIKKEAEMLVLKAGGTVVRTSLVYSFNPPDHRTMELIYGLQSGCFKYAYFVDEIRCPIFIKDLCNALIEISADTKWSGKILHVAGPEAISRFDFAAVVADFLGYNKKLIPMGSLFASDHARPKDVSLNINLAITSLDTHIRNVDQVWEQGA